MKTQKELTVGFMLHKFSKDERKHNVCWRIQLITKIVVLVASTQNLSGIFFAWSILQQISIICLYYLSVTPFCCGVLAHVNSWCIWLSQRYWKNSFELYFSPLLVHKQRILLSTSTSTVSLNSLNFKNISDFTFIKNKPTHTLRSYR